MEQSQSGISFSVTAGREYSGVGHVNISSGTNPSINDMEKVRKLVGIFKEMVANASSFGDYWKNISLGRQAFEIMKELPDVLEGEYDSPADKAELLEKMLGQMDENLTPRFCLSVREYIKGYNPDSKSNNAMMERLTDYIDESLPMPEYCKKYGKLLKFDPVERSERMEEIVEQVERECAEATAGIPRAMGYCFGYWSAKRSILNKYGVRWRSPHEMNPGVMFD